MDSMRVLGEGRGREGGEDSQPTHRYIEHNWRDSPVRRYTLNSSPRTRSSSPSSATTPSPSHPHWIPAPLVSKVSEWSVIRVVRSGRVIGFGWAGMDRAVLTGGVQPGRCWERAGDGQGRDHTALTSLSVFRQHHRALPIALSRFFATATCSAAPASLACRSLARPTRSGPILASARLTPRRLYHLHTSLLRAPALPARTTGSD